MFHSTIAGLCNGKNNIVVETRLPQTIYWSLLYAVTVLTCTLACNHTVMPQISITTAFQLNIQSL